ncbi:hypothetical protein CRI70_24905 [Streptomyces sp. Ru87]|nr:hypothetical protein CRI70_24905 [Streptomyces sp. Ru87]
MAGGLGVGERGGQGVPCRVVEDLLGVAGCGFVDVAEEVFGGGLWGLAVGECGQGCCGGLVVGGSQVVEGSAGGGDLLVVVVELVPPGGGEDDQECGVEEHREAGPVPGRGLGTHGAQGSAEGPRVVVFGVDAGAGGAFEGGGGLAELGA